MTDETTPVSPPRLPAHQIRALSVAAETDPRSVRKFLSNGNLQPLLRQRIARALRRLHLVPLIAESAQR